MEPSLLSACLNFLLEKENNQQEDQTAALRYTIIVAAYEVSSCLTVSHGRRDSSMD